MSGGDFLQALQFAEAVHLHGDAVCIAHRLQEFFIGLARSAEHDVRAAGSQRQRELAAAGDVQPVIQVDQGLIYIES